MFTKRPRVYLNYLILLDFRCNIVIKKNQNLSIFTITTFNIIMILSNTYWQFSNKPTWGQSRCGL